MAKNHVILKIVLVSGFLGLNACSFKKSGDEAPATPPNVIVEKDTAHAKTAQEALLASDMAGFEKHLSTMNAETVNAYLEDGGTLLEMAVRNNNLYAVELLLKKGALPLKPRKNSSQTPLAISEKLNPSIYQAFVENLAVVKKDILAKLQQGQALAALQVLDANFISRDAKVSESSNTLEILIDSQTALTPDTREALMTLLPLKASLENRAEKLLTLALSDKELFKVSVETLKKQAVNVPGSLRLTLLKQTSLELFAAHLASFNSYPSNQKVPLAELQKILISKAIDAQTEGQFINVESLRLPLSLMKSEASDQVFSAECIELILRSPKLAAQRAEIVSLVIMNSSDAPAGFIKSLVGRLPLNDFKHVVNVLPLKVRQEQKDAFDSNWSKEEYKEMKNAGLLIPANVTLKLFRELFEERFKGNAAASERLQTLKDELKDIKKDITKEEANSLFQKEFIFIVERDLKDEDLFSLIGLATSAKIEGLYLGQIENQELNGLVSTKENLILNPLQVLDHKYLNSTNATFRANVPLIAQTIATLIPDSKEKWFMKSGTWKLTQHDALVLSLSNDTELQYLLIPQLKNPLVLKTYNAWKTEELHNSEGFANALKVEDSRYGTADANYRNKYLPFFLSGKLNELRVRLVLDTVGAMPLSAYLTDKSAAGKLVNFILSNVNNKYRDDLFKTLLIPYIKKQNPRFMLAVDGQNKRYLSFLNGNFKDDPLCTSQELNSYKEVCASHEETTGFKYPFPEPKGMNLAKILNYRNAKEKWEEDSKQRYIFEKIGQDKITIEAFKELAKNVAAGSEIDSFIKANPWIFEATFTKDINTFNFPKTK